MIDKMIPSNGQNTAIAVKKPRNSNLELYRIICMLMIVAHHYVVNSGLTSVGGPMDLDTSSANSLFLRIFGMWGKTCINCFMMITGYYMCKNKITIKKFLKLLLQVYLYRILFFIVFMFAGYETIDMPRLIKLIMPIWEINNNFVSCFIAFYLTIPFLTILVQNLTKRYHELLLILLLGIYTIFGSIPHFYITFNYLTWFGIIFLISSYIRMYPNPIFESRKLWGWMTLVCILLAIVVELLLNRLFGVFHFPVADCN